MDDLLGALHDQQTELDTLLDGLDDDGWHAASRCDGWDVADVVLHLAQTNEMAIASVEHRMDEFLAQALEGMPPAANVDDGAGAMVDKERGLEPDVIGARWRDGGARLRGLLAAADPSERVTWVAGQLSVRTLATTRLAETWIHTLDAYAAFGSLPAPTDRLEHIARLAWRTLPYAFQRAGETPPGSVAFDLTGPSGQAWTFTPDEPAATTISGDAFELCNVAAQRADAGDTSLRGAGPDAERVLALVRTFA